jgi:hypothetical protein
MTDGEKQIWAAMFAAHYVADMRELQRRGEDTYPQLNAVIRISVEETTFVVKRLRELFDNDKLDLDSSDEKAVMEMLDG